MKFISKRNDVTLENGEVVKRFRSQNGYDNELKIAQALQNTAVNVAQIIHHDERIIHYEYIVNEVYAELAEELTFPMAQAISDWLDSYYAERNASPADVNLRNFLYQKDSGKCYGIDFEDEEIEKNRNRDFARIIAFCSAYEPTFSENKAKSCKKLLEVFAKKADTRQMKTEFCLEIADMKRRRGDTINFPISAEQFWDKITGCEKNLGYSIEKLRGFLADMDGVSYIRENEYLYKNAKIELEALMRDESFIIKIDRCLMKLSGDKADIDEFYNKFLVNYMTMGG